MTRNRHGEDGGVPNRSDRIFSQDMVLYFETREGHRKGPYQYYDDAQLAIERFIRKQCLPVREIDDS